MKPITVNRLRVESISDPTPDPYGQPGFSALTAYLDDADAALVRAASARETTVTVRCATLEVQGRIVKPLAGEKPGAVVISVDDLRYFKPVRALR